MRIDRRKLLKGASGLAVVTGLAGCIGGGDDGDDGDDDGGSDGDDGASDDGDDGSDGDGINIGVLVPFSGDYAWVGANVMPVAEMVAEDINDHGGIDGQEVSIIQADTEASPDASLSAIQQLIEVEGVEAIVGPTSLTFSAVADEFEQNQVPCISPTAGTTSLDERGGEWIFRTVPSDALGGRALARAARDEEYNTIQEYSEMALMVGNDEVFQSFKEPIGSSFEEFGGTVVEEIDFRTGKASYQSEVESMVSADPEIAALVASPEDSIKIMEAAFQAGYEGNWFVTQDQTNEDFLAQSEDQVTDGVLGLQEAVYEPAEESGRFEEFQNRIEERTGEEPGIFAENTYDATNVIGLAMKQAEVDGDDVTGASIQPNITEVANPPEDAVTNYQDGADAIEDGADVDYQGLAGPIDFNEYGDINAPFSIMTAEGGDWEEAARVPPEALE